MSNEGGFAGDKSAVIIRSATEIDLDQIVEVHLVAFKGFFLTLMGKLFVREYYVAVASFPGSIFLVAQDPMGRLLGFIAGFREPTAFYLHYKRHRFRLILIALAALVRRPSLLGRIIGNAIRVVFGRGTHITTHLGEIEISSFAVLPEYQGQGIGGLLLESFIASARGSHAISIYLTTDTVENQRVNVFYQKHGFVMEKTVNKTARQLNVYRYTLTTTSSY